MITPSHVQRLLVEAAELNAKLKKLREFTRSYPEFDTMHPYDQMLMRAQRDVMAEYLGILENRLERAVSQREITK